MTERPVKAARARQFIKAVTAHDFVAAEALLDPDVESVPPRGTLRGVAACRQVLQKAGGDEHFALEQAEPEFEEIGGDIIGPAAPSEVIAFSQAYPPLLEQG